MSLEQLSSNDKTRLTDFMDAAVKVLQEVQDLNDGLKDTAKNLAEEFNVKPALLLRAARTSFKSSMDEEKEKVGAVEDILEATGRR